MNCVNIIKIIHINEGIEGKMISRTIDIHDINQFIIDQLSIFFNKSSDLKKMEKFEFTTHNKIYGPVKFKKEKSDTVVHIHFSSCRYGYDFYNSLGQSTSDICDKDECAVCYEDTEHKIQCGHRLCGKCITEIMKHSKTFDCPLCRKKHETSGGLDIKYPAHLMLLLFA